MPTLLLKRLLGAFLSGFNPNSSVFYLGIVNWAVTYAFDHLGWLASLGVTPEGMRIWLLATGAVMLKQLIGKVVHGAFPALTFGTLTPAVPSAPSVAGTPVMATVAATNKITANPDTPTSAAKK